MNVVVYDSHGADGDAVMLRCSRDCVRDNDDLSKVQIEWKRQNVLARLKMCSLGDRKSIARLYFSLDYIAVENYTFVSCFMYLRQRSMKLVEWERRQTQPKAKHQTKATHSGNAHDAFPEVFKPVSKHVSRCSQNHA